MKRKWRLQAEIGNSFVENREITIFLEIVVTEVERKGWVQGDMDDDN